MKALKLPRDFKISFAAIDEALDNFLYFNGGIEAEEILMSEGLIPSYARLVEALGNPEDCVNPLAYCGIPVIAYK